MGPATKTAFYVKRVQKGLTNLGSTLRRNIRTMWKIARSTAKAAKLTFNGFTIPTSQVS